MPALPADTSFDEFVVWLQERPGLPPTAGSWTSFAAEVMRRRDGIEDALLAPTVISDPGEGLEFERWGPSRRLRWNINALRVLQAIRLGEVLDPGLVQRALRAYTGWGGFTRVLADLPTTPGLFDTETTSAIIEWKTAHRTGRRPSSAVLVLNEGLRTQYFTPVSVCGVMWSYALRLVEGPIRRVLEPSAGIGRMIDTLPVSQIGEVEVLAVEFDRTLAGLLEHRHANTRVRVESGAFEDCAAPRGSFDLVISNPPYMERSAALRRRAEPTISHAEHFSLVRSLNMLRPGGAVVSLVPASLVQGTSPEQVGHRTRMYEHGDFRGAVLLPAACFPSVPNLLCVQVWTRREAPRSVSEAQALAAVPYDFPPSNILGQLVDAYRGKKVEGTFDPLAAEQVTWLTRNGTGVVEGPPSALVIPSAPMVVETTPTPAEGRRRVQAAPTSERTAPVDYYRQMSVESLGARLAAYYHRLDQGMLTLAEIGRSELLSDLEWHTNLWGRPEETELTRLPVGSRGGWGRFLRDGVTSRPLVEMEEAPRPGSTPFETVAHFCRLQGFCSEDNLDRYFSGQTLLLDLVTQGVLLAPDPSGGFCYFTEEHFLTGDVSARLTALTTYVRDSAEQLAEFPTVLARLQAGAARLEAIIGSTNVLNLGISPRSNLVPQDMRTAWIKAVVHPESVVSYDGAFYDIRMRRASGKITTLEGYLTNGFEDFTKHRARSEAKKRDKTERDLIFGRAVSMLGYLNRQTQVETGGDGRRNVFPGGTPFAARQAAEQEIEDSFTRWLSQPEQASYAQQLEAMYNDRIHRQGGRLYSTDPVPLARLNQTIPLKEHQNQTVRWQMDRLGGFLFDAVGAGKTYAILGSIVAARQSGRVRRFIITVPVSTLAQWYAQSRLLLPDYRIALIGLQPFTDKNGKRGVKEEDQASRAVKWRAFRDGYYDLLIVGHQGFLGDVYPTAETIETTMADQSWLQRGLAKKAATRLKAQKELISYQRALANTPDIDPTSPRVVEHIEALQKIIADNTPKDKEIQDAVADGQVPADGYRPKGAADIISWEEVVGPDVGLAVDEAHIYKNLWAPAARLGATIAFLGATEKKTKKSDGADEEMQLTKMSWDLLFKCTHLSKERGDGQGVLLATATPYSNSPIELYNLGCYLSPRFWPDNGIEHKEEFIDAFLDIQEVNTASVMTLEGHVGPGVRGFKKPGPLARLLSILAPVMQRRTKEDLTVAGIIQLPTVNRENIVVSMNGAQARANDAIRAVAEERIMRKIRKREGRATAEDEEWTWGKENSLTLALMSLLSDVALDPRLLVLDYYRSQGTPVDERRFIGTKKPEKEAIPSEDLFFVYNHIWEIMGRNGVNMPGDLEEVADPEKFVAIAERMLADWRVQEAAGRKRAGVLIFLDSVEAHDWFIDVLVRYGIDRDRIAVISGAVTKPKRDQISLDYNGRSAVWDPITNELIEEAHTPQYDVLIGNSKAMATGLNLQRRTGSIYHVTFTWEPATIEQREGRGVRQGNSEGAIGVYNVIAEKSFDGILVNTSQGKSEWQNEVFPGIAPVASASTGMDREQALIDWVVRDPEAAKKLFTEIRERQKRENEARTRLMAWRVWSAAYANVRQIILGNPRAAQILSGVRYTLENSPRSALSIIPRAVVDRLIAGEAAYPDLVGGIPIFFGGNRFTYADGHTEDVRVLNAYATDRMVSLYHRKRGQLVVEETRIYKPTGNDAVVFPGVVASEPIPWNRRAEAKGMSDFVLGDVFLGCLDQTSDKRDRILCQRIWEGLQDRVDLFDWGKDFADYHSPKLEHVLTHAETTLPDWTQPVGEYDSFQRSRIRFIMQLESGELAVMAGYDHTDRYAPGKALRIRRFLMPRDPADGAILKDALLNDRIKVVNWKGQIKGSALVSPANTWDKSDKAATMLWTYYFCWLGRGGGQISEETLTAFLAQPVLAGVTEEDIRKKIGGTALYYPRKKTTAGANMKLPAGVEGDQVEAGL